MDVVLDTSVLSLFLRRNRNDLSKEQLVVVHEVERLVKTGREVITGPVKQEILSGLRNENAFDRILEGLHSLRPASVVDEDFVNAARFYNACRDKGVTSSPSDVLICAIATRLNATVFSMDKDFDFYQSILPVNLHQEWRT